MTSAHYLILLAAGLPLVATGDEPQPKLSEHLRQELAAFRPAFTPSPARAEADDDPAAPRDAELLILPKLEVKERRLPGHDPDAWLADSVVQRQAMAHYQDSMTDFEWALNRWHIPLITPSAAARARSAYRAAKIRDETLRLDTVIKAIERLDPKEAGRLRRELYRPADSLPDSEN